MYSEILEKNQTYLSEKVLSQISHSSILIAGCGLGNAIAEYLIHCGCKNITLIDDQIFTHSFNIQTKQYGHIKNKHTQDLRDRLLAINPETHIKIICQNLNQVNIREIIGQHNLIFDTLDFLDFSRSLVLHDCAQVMGIPIISSVAIGWGYGGLIFNEHSTSFREMFSLPKTGMPSISCKDIFKEFLENISYKPGENAISATEVVSTIADCFSFPEMQGKRKSIVGTLFLYSLIKYLSKEPIPSAPDLIYLDYNDWIALQK